MAETKTTCTACGRQILELTAQRNGGLCGVCLREAEHAQRVSRAQVAPAADPIQLTVRIDMSRLRVADCADWQAVEDTLVSIASQYLQQFAAIHKEKTFYGLAFDCHADYGQVFLCANSPAALTTQAIEYKARWPDLYGERSIDEVEDELRWSLGDWEFQAFTTEVFSRAWSAVEELIVEMMPWDDDQQLEAFRFSFLETACRAMIRLESEGVLGALSRTSDFKTFVADHDEPADDSWSRLDSVRCRLRGVP